MQLWGLGLDLVTCISLQLSVGLCIGKIPIFLSHFKNTIYLQIALLTSVTLS